MKKPNKTYEIVKIVKSTSMKQALLDEKSTEPISIVLRDEESTNKIGFF